MSKNFNDYVQKVASFLSTTNEELDAKLRVDYKSDLAKLDLDYYSNGALVICTEDGTVYQYLKSNSEVVSTGKWRAYSSGGGGGSSYYPILVGNIDDDTTAFPGSRPDGTSLQLLDYVYVNPKMTLPKTISNKSITSYNDVLFYIGSDWTLIHQDVFTKNILLTNSESESISGSANTQMQANQEFKIASNDIDMGVWD